MPARYVAAVDLGATSGRVMVGALDNAPTPRLTLVPSGRFPNTPISTDSGLHWNLPSLIEEIRRGLDDAASAYPLASVGIDSWAVDYAILTGQQHSLPFHYRDDRTHPGVESVHSRIPFPELYRRNGLQFLPFNTLYQLAMDPPESLRGADAILLIPDLIAYLLTGEVRTEYTNASTTGLLSGEGLWDAELIARLGLPLPIFPPLIHPGESLGVITDPSLTEAHGVPVIAVGSHDTASAVAAVPMDPTSAAYISCGTWGLVGVETNGRITNDAAREANFTNEAGVDGTNRFLHNVMGMWLLNESVDHWNRALPPDEKVNLPTLLHAASGVAPPPTGWVFDVNDPIFMAPGDIPVRIQEWFIREGLQPPSTPVQIVRATVESLAVAFTEAVRTASELSGVEVRTIHMVGGGSLNELLCQRTADLSGAVVLAGPVEATAIGNLLVQARHHGWIDSRLAGIRQVVKDSFAVKRYSPRTTERLPAG